MSLQLLGKILMLSRLFQMMLKVGNRQPTDKRLLIQVKNGCFQCVLQLACLLRPAFMVRSSETIAKKKSKLQKSKQHRNLAMSVHM